MLDLELVTILATIIDNIQYYMDPTMLVALVVELDLAIVIIYTKLVVFHY